MDEETEHYPVPIMWLGKQDWTCNCGDKNCASLVDHPLFNTPGTTEPPC